MRDDLLALAMLPEEVRRMGNVAGGAKRGELNGQARYKLSLAVVLGRVFAEIMRHWGS